MDAVISKFADRCDVIKYSLVALSVVAVAFFAGPSKSVVGHDQGELSIVINVHKVNSGTAIITRIGGFQVDIKNQSEKPVNLWREQCQLGYETLSFKVEDSDGLPSLMHKYALSSTNWKNKTPTTITIQPGEKISWEVTLDKGQWKSTPEPNTGNVLRLTAVFEIKPTDDANAKGVWTGRIESEPVNAQVVDASLRTPFEYLNANCPKQALSTIQADHSWITSTDDDQQTPLHLAARFGFIDVAQWLLTNGGNANARAYNKFTPLHFAGDPEMVKLLLEHNADINAKCVSGTKLEVAASDFARFERFPEYITEAENALAITKILLGAGAEYDILSACYLDDIEIVRALIKDEKQARDTEAMRWAATYGRTNIVKLLLEHGADPEGAGYGGLTVSYFAIEHPDVLKLLFDAGADPKVHVEYHGNGASVLNDNGSTLLHVAAAKGCIESADLLLRQGIDVNLPTSSGETPLHVASAAACIPMVEWLLKNAADAKAQDEQGWTSMSWAASQVRPKEDEENARYQAVIRIFERAGVDGDVFSAIACNDVQLVTNILQKTAKVGEARDRIGRPALHRAVTLDRGEIVKLLLDNGANPDIRSIDDVAGQEGETALLEAAFWGRPEIAELLIARGANVNARDKNGFVPLHEAARMNNIDVVRLLLTHGADVNEKTKDGSTPLDWASRSEESREIVKLLQDHGGKK